ncbi:hypothetical protein BDY24DRAFT_388821, partial [Mrakia frigida]|uniref:uncharacterized protein n=1 Tax=Mrakia frigida TaxID=29902 RepID=UPI003FCC0470
VVHVLPGVGVGGGEGGVKALEVLEERGWVVCLLGSGYVSIFSLLDGLCLSTVQIPSSVASSSFVWNSMAVSKSASTYRAIITGSTTTPPWDPSFSSDSPSPSRSSKIVVLDLEEMECLPCPTPVPDLPFAISTVQLISKEEEPPLLLLSPSSSPSHHLLPFTLHPHSHPHPPSNPNTTSSTPTSSPNPSSPPPPAPSSHSTDLSAKVVTKAFKDLFHRASASSKPTSSTTDGAGGLVAGGWTLSFGEVQSLVASSSNELGVAGRGGCLSFGAG